MRQQISLLFLLILLGTGKSWGQCSVFLSGLTGLTVVGITDSSVSFEWTGTATNQTYKITVTNDSTNSGQPPFTYLYSDVPNTFASQTRLQPGTRYYIFVMDSACGTHADSVSFMTMSTCASAPAPTIRSETGSFTVCGNGGLLLASSSPTGNQWYANGNPVPDSTGATFVVSQTGGYSLQVTTPEGCLTKSGMQSVLIDPGPPIPVLSAAGPTAICSGSSVNLISSVSAGNQWYQDNTLLDGETTNQFTATQAGIYFVKEEDLAGCWTLSNELTVTIVGSAAGSQILPVVTPAGPLLLCGDSAAVLVSSAAANYQWFENGDVLPGAEGDSLVVTQTGSYTVVTGKTGCDAAGGLSAAVQVQYIGTTSPVITMVNGVMVSNFATNNQWYLNDSLIYGATNQNYTPKTTGSYTVRLAVGFPPLGDNVPIGVGGCYSEFSAPYIIVDSSLARPQVQVYPNPVIDQLTLVNARPGAVTIRIFDMMGRNILTRQLLTGTTVVDVRGWEKGGYALLVIDEATQQETRLMILRL